MSMIKFMFYLTCLSLLVGCAVKHPKEFEKKLSQLDRKSLVLATISLDDKYYGHDKYDYWDCILVTKKDKNDDNYVKYNFVRYDNELSIRSKESGDYTAVYAMNKGNHFLYSLRGVLFKRWRYEAPILLNCQVKENEIVYIGNINLILREKTSDSEVEGVIGLLGDFKGTWDIEIKDEFERDINRFEKVYPNLKGLNVVKRILPQWKRPSNQEFVRKKTTFGFW